MDGTSFLYTFDDPNAEERHTVQYFEMIGSRAIYKDGWWACARLDKAPWDFSPAALARVRPRQVGPRAGRLGAVLPAGRLLAGEGPRGGEPREARRAEGAVLAGGGAQPGAAAARLHLRLLRHPAAAADGHPLHVRGRRPEHPEGPRPPRRRTLVRDRGGARDPEGGAEGVILANADFIGGFGLWVDGDGKLNHTYSFLGVESYRQTSTKPIPTGDVTREDAVRGRRAEAGQRRATSRSGPTASRSARAGSRRPRR